MRLKLRSCLLYDAYARTVIGSFLVLNLSATAELLVRRSYVTILLYEQLQYVTNRNCSRRYAFDYIFG